MFFLRGGKGDAWLMCDQYVTTLKDLLLRCDHTDRVVAKVGPIWDRFLEETRQSLHTVGSQTFLCCTLSMCMFTVCCSMSVHYVLQKVCVYSVLKHECFHCVLQNVCDHSVLQYVYVYCMSTVLYQFHRMKMWNMLRSGWPVPRVNIVTKKND